MAAHDIQKHFKSLRVDTGRRRGRDPFADSFEDDSDDDKNRRSRSKTKQSPPTEKEKPSAPVAPAKTSVSSPFSAVDAIRDSDDDFLDAPKRIDRRPSPAPSKLPVTRVTDGAGRRGSVDKGLQSKGVTGRVVQTSKAPRSAVAQAAGQLAYLDDSEDSEENQPAPRANRYPSPAPGKQSDTVDTVQRSSTPRGTREPSRDALQIQSTTQPSLHTVASPFAGTKYLQDSDSEEEAISSRKNSTEDAISSAATTDPDKQKLEVKRIDKPKQNGGGVSWRAFSAGRAEQRSTEIEALQTSLRQRGKSIAFGTHAVTDDGNKVPVQHTAEQIVPGRGRKKGRGKSPPRRSEDTKPTDDEMADAEPVGIYDPKQYKTNPFTGEPVRRTRSDGDRYEVPERQGGPQRSTGAAGGIPHIRVDNIA